MEKSQGNNRITILGCPVDNLTLEETVKVVEGFIAEGKPRQYIAINAGKIVKMNQDPEFRGILFDSDLNIVDGQPLLWIARLFGTPVKQRFGGIDIIDAVMPVSEKKGYGIYFLGGKKEILDEVVEKYKKMYPALKIAGTRDGYWKAEEEAGVVKKIKESGADIIFFAMSSPRKEEFLKKNMIEMGVPFVAGVGGAFDVISGRTKRAPVWVQKIGMEWFYRILQEPGRLWKRYFFSNTLFAWIVIREAARRFIFKTGKKI
ncbi:MAG: WecB/TagA/CpsF family glycosyltransferase [Candidatus Omnitrophota bacterium]